MKERDDDNEDVWDEGWKWDKLRLSGGCNQHNRSVDLLFDQGDIVHRRKCWDASLHQRKDGLSLLLCNRNTKEYLLIYFNSSRTCFSFCFFFFCSSFGIRSWRSRTDFQHKRCACLHSSTYNEGTCFIGATNLIHLYPRSQSFFSRPK